jgi:aminopeptidase N
LRHPTLDAAFKELVLTLPSETYMAEQLDVVDPQRIHAVREACGCNWPWDCKRTGNGPLLPTRTTGLPPRRRIQRSTRTGRHGTGQFFAWHATQTGDAVWPGKALQRFKDASNMTDRFNALQAWSAADHELANLLWLAFTCPVQGEDLVLDKWFALQAGAPDRGGKVLPAVRQLMAHPDFNLRNPNRARSVIFSYCSANPGGFHRADAAGYVFWSERVRSSTASTRRSPHAWRAPWTAGSGWSNLTAAPPARHCPAWPPRRT